MHQFGHGYFTKSKMLKEKIS